ncbi:YxcD family protein [Paenibacillus nanensis]|uniref:YxcD family protein n=1 Tax=Paenibacillus nanensis TaxID=393251 RepID=UPI0013C35E92|nr:YxcD family protein [Paenibacillus nanensis]
MRIYTDEIINAICLHTAERRGIQPTDVEVQLGYDEEYGITAEMWVGGRSQYLITANLLEAIEQYLFSHYNRRVFRSDISLGIDEEAEEFWAEFPG